MKNTNMINSGYEFLRQDLLNILETGQERFEQAVAEIRVTTYWKMGERLAREPDVKDPAKTPALFRRLQESLRLSPQSLYQVLRFYRTYPDGLSSVPDAKKLSWGAHLELLSVRDEKERGYYLQLAVEEGMSRARVRTAIKTDLYGRTTGEASETLEALDRPKSGLHFYKAVVERVVDGDTLKVRVDLGFNTWRVEKLRLRGVDTPPFSTRRGQAAKVFVEKTLAEVPFIVIRTYKTDRYARYVADVFHDASRKKKAQVFNKGFFLNQQLLDAGHAVRMIAG
jgi:endonuclease YncB( thermonuclease family)